MDRSPIIISPLNWGFGHAGRIIPLVKEIRKRGHEVVIAADNALKAFFINELGDVPFIELPGVKIVYSGHLPQYLTVFFRLPLLVAASVREHFMLRRIVRQLKPGMIISDNMFGLYHRDIFSVYITHQLRIPFPGYLRWIEPAGIWLHRRVIRNFDLCLVPDYPGAENLSGRLSHDLRITPGITFIGPLSRFENTAVTEGSRAPGGYTLLILSGPEPQRSALLRRVMESVDQLPLVVLSPTPVPDLSARHQNVTIISGAGTSALQNAIAGSKFIIARSGYTTIMELRSLGRGALLIPTPGQTEQEYLADYNMNRNGFVTLAQAELKPELIIPSMEKCAGLFPPARQWMTPAMVTDLLFKKKEERAAHDSCTGSKA